MQLPGKICPVWVYATWCGILGDRVIFTLASNVVTLAFGISLDHLSSTHGRNCSYHPVITGMDSILWFGFTPCALVGRY